MTIAELNAIKNDLGMTDLEISQKSGIPVNTVREIMNGITKVSGKNTIEVIEAIEGVILQEKEARGRKEESSTLDEPAVYRVPSRKNIYTVDDYYALPEERRMELIDGVLYDMTAPTFIHQKILGELYAMFRECMEAHGKDCDIYFAPCDVRLDRDNRTMVQPDLLVICGDYDFTAKAYDGAPDLTVEILSSSTRAKDMFLKLYKYQNAGVKEYWIIDPEQERVIVYNFDSGSFWPSFYDFDEVIPIGLTNGECSIDFARINRALQKRG